MASKISVSTYFGCHSSLCRYWALFIVLISLLSTESVGFFIVNAEPTMMLHHLPRELVSPSNSNTPSSIFPVSLTYFTNSSFLSSPLVTIPLKDLPNVPQLNVLLTIFSPNDSLADNFILEIANPPYTSGSSLSESIIYAFVGVTVTNLCAVTGFICIPFKRSRHFNKLINFMTALAVGALFSTAVLVLIPESMRMIDMPLEFGGQGRSYLLKLGCVPAGALFFFVVEYILMILPRLMKWNITTSDVEETSFDPRTEKNWEENSNTLRQFSNPELSGEEDMTIKEGVSGSLDDSVHITDPKATNVSSSREHGSRACCLFRFKKEKFAQIAPVAWMILIGDGFHNFMDGMTIGVGFTESPTVGVALSLSILFEELPHELGDFAVLISSGFSVRAAVAANFLSACSAYVGLVLGLVIGEVSEGALYVFSITAGFFLYISLSDMLPNLREALEERERRKEGSLGLFVIQVLGQLVGFGCVIGVTLVSDLISF